MRVRCPQGNSPNGFRQQLQLFAAPSQKEDIDKMLGNPVMDKPLPVVFPVFLRESFKDANRAVQANHSTEGSDALGFGIGSDSVEECALMIFVLVEFPGLIA
jgi:hypothetical protein